MFDLTKLSAAKLALIFNAVTTGQAVKKFESTPRALERTLAELATAGVDADEAARRAGLLDGGETWLAEARAVMGPSVESTPPAAEPAPECRALAVIPEPAPGAFEAVNLVTGNVVALKSLHGPVRTVEGDPAKAAKIAATAAAAPYRAARQAAIAAIETRAEAFPAAEMLPADGPARSNRTLPHVVAWLQREEGATLAELTVASGWRAPFELVHLRKAAEKLGFEVSHTGTGEARRYKWVAPQGKN